MINARQALFIQQIESADSMDELRAVAHAILRWTEAFTQEARDVHKLAAWDQSIEERDRRTLFGLKLYRAHARKRIRRLEKQLARATRLANLDATGKKTVQPSA